MSAPITCSVALFRQASLFIEQRKFDRAALYSSRVTALDPSSANSYFQLAVAEEGRYRFPDAGKAYARALELAPKTTATASATRPLRPESTVTE